MDTFTARLNARRQELGLTVQDVVSALQLQGVSAAYQTVAAWFNGGRGERWEPATLHAVLSLLQTDLAAMLGASAPSPPDFASPILTATSRELASLPEHQQVAILSLIKSFRQ